MTNIKKFRAALISTRTAAIPQLQTELLFDVDHCDPLGSPLDEFLGRMSEINKLSPHPDKFNVYQGQLLLLGAVAAVESFIRTIFRKIIMIDPESQARVHQKDIAYGAALHMSSDLLPEALLERVSFVGRGAIIDALRDILGVRGNIPDELDQAMQAYMRICQLRHCAVHRFGKLGAKNAIALGLEAHKELIEKPLRFNYASLQISVAVATAMAKVLNNFLFNEILSRVPAENWTGDYSRDGLIFDRYYNLFSDRTSYSKTPSPSDLYVQFYSQLADWRIRKNRTPQSFKKSVDAVDEEF